MIIRAKNGANEADKKVITISPSKVREVKEKLTKLSDVKRDALVTVFKTMMMNPETTSVIKMLASATTIK